ncbi:MAG: histidine kinase [Pseudomonadota bacterium]
MVASYLSQRVRARLMGGRELESQIQIDSTRSAQRWFSLTGLVFTVLWPSFNLLLIAAVQSEFGTLNVDMLLRVAIRLYGVFLAAYLVIGFLQRAFPKMLARTRLWSQLLLHLAVFGCLAMLVSPAEPRPVPADVPNVAFIPLTLFGFQIISYVVTTTMLAHREQSHASTLNLRQAQINLLRSQSNPHFLFNTLNLLASEILSRPESAREIVYDLSDLLRQSIIAAEKSQITVKEELHLVDLYLKLQEKRFPDRFSYSMKVADKARSKQIPALLLQPIVENVIKHAVAQTSQAVHLDIVVDTTEDQLTFLVSDDGSHSEPVSIEEGGGFRILRDTLSLHYPGRHKLSFSVTQDGAELNIKLPLQEHVVV